MSPIVLSSAASVISILGKRDPDLGSVDLGIGDTALAGKDGGLMAVRRVKGTFGTDRVARVLRLERGRGGSAVVVGSHGVVLLMKEDVVENESK